MRIIKFLLFALLTAGLFHVMEFGVGPLPALGKFLSPFSGFWQNAESKNAKIPATLELEGLLEDVKVVFDDRMVPHIFAKNEHDLFFAQGYITASHRLWQMEFQTHFAAGRISEIVGEKAIDLDRMQRRKGLLYAAELTVEAFERDSLANSILQAYSDGVNAYIKSLNYKHLPLEYKLLNYKPEPWSKLKSALLLKYMADMLTGNSNDIELSNAVALLGYEVTELIYPDFPDSLIDPIIPRDVVFNQATAKLDTPAVPGLGIQIPIEPEKISENIGSNNWAVNGNKTATGAPILCNDPHLQLNLPSIWYEVQLSTPQFNVYGVSLPGAPAVIIGFNNEIAWGVTNGTQDVKDWYKVKFKDASRKEYLFDGTWKQTTVRIEEIKIKGKKPFYDTVVYTHFGPVVYDASLTKDTSAINLAARWTGLEPSNELMTFYYLNRAKNYTDYLRAIETFQCPGQNFVFASASGDIAIWQQGKFPLKWPKQGKYVMDGSSSIYQWQGYIPQAENPHVLNPSRNFVSSANQHPTDATYPYYYNGFFEFYRNRRINERLAMMQKITVEDMMKLQNDNFNLQAAESLPLMLKLLGDVTEGAEYIEILEKWNYMNDALAEAPAIYEEWFAHLDSLIWDELHIQGKMIEIPQEFYTIWMMHNYPHHSIFDIKSTTDNVETLEDLIQLSFHKTQKSLNYWKEVHKENLTWYNYKSTSVQHLARLIPFSQTNIQIGGNKRIVNACDSRWGPSWRMIVSLEKPVKAYGVYPGGQSGNPGSPYYTTGIEKWSKGEYFTLNFMQHAEEISSGMTQQILKHK
ncbi:MAG: penicillin acylase family protein [Flavobacteriales bacterium]|nr:penicillin acylase family protein [Flavobacteriales bacterium]